jgi:hypothetical protein
MMPAPGDLRPRTVTYSTCSLVNNTQGYKRDLGARDRDLWLSTRDETLQKFSETETFDLGLETRPIQSVVSIPTT